MRQCAIRCNAAGAIRPDPVQIGDRLQAQCGLCGLCVIGLFIAKEIAATHGETTAVASDAEKGTVFTVGLPRGVPRLL